MAAWPDLTIDMSWNTNISTVHNKKNSCKLSLTEEQMRVQMTSLRHFYIYRKRLFSRFLGLNYLSETFSMLQKPNNESHFILSAQITV